MVTTPNFDLDTDTTLGGSNASDYVIPSQKAIKSYVDNNSGGGGTVDQTYDPTSANGQSGIAIAGAGFLQVKGAITSSTTLTSLATGIYTVDGVTHAGFPNPSQAYYGVLIQYGGTYKPQLLVAGVPASNGLYYRRYLTGSSSFTAWGSIPTVPTNVSAFTNDAGYLTSIPSGYLQNTATGTNALTLLGTATNQSGSINIGYGSSVTNTDSVVIGENAESAYAQTVAIGYQANANDSSSIAIGYGAYTNYSQATAIGTSSQATKAGTVAVGSNAQATQTQANAFGYNAQSTGYGSIALGYGAQVSANYAIQIGNGTNSTASTLAVGFNGTNYQLLDGTTGLIPDARISSNIARTSDIPDSEIFVAEYGTTTYADIKGAYNNGKVVFCNDSSNNSIYPLLVIDEINEDCSFGCISGRTSLYIDCGLQNGNTVWSNGVFNLAQSNLSNVSSIGSGSVVADNSLSNLSATGKTVIDGQWVSSYKQIDSTTSIHTTKHNLGTTGTGALSYLPADCTTYDYEVFVAVYGATSSSGVSHGYAYNNSTATDGQYGRVTCNANARHGNNSFTLPIYNGEIWTSVGTTAFGSSFSVILLGYRRLGTNS